VASVFVCPTGMLVGVSSLFVCMHACVASEHVCIYMHLLAYVYEFLFVWIQI
jgi:hypothetical protein